MRQGMARANLSFISSAAWGQRELGSEGVGVRKIERKRVSGRSGDRFTLFVKVMSWIDLGLTFSRRIRCLVLAIRVVVFPVPAPASMRRGMLPDELAATLCSSLSLGSGALLRDAWIASSCLLDSSILTNRGSTREEVDRLGGRWWAGTSGGAEGLGRKEGAAEVWSVLEV